MPATMIDRMRWLSTLAGFVVMATDPAFAQTPGSSTTTASSAGEDRWAVSFGADVRAPAGEFSDTGGGIRMSVDRRLAHSVFSVGGEVVFLLYGQEHSPYSGVYRGRTLSSATTDHTSFNIAALLRAHRSTGKWRPYADVVFGTHTYRTTTSVDGTGSTVCSPQGACSTVGEVSSTQLSDTALAYGGGAGLMRTITKDQSTFLEFSIRYLRGGEAQYLTNGAIEREGNVIIHLDITRSRTDAVAVYLGIRFGHPFF